MRFYTENGPIYVFEGQRTMIILGSLEKRAVDFLLVLIGLFSLGVTAQALRANIGSKSAISLQRGPVDPNF